MNSQTSMLLDLLESALQEIADLQEQLDKTKEERDDYRNNPIHLVIDKEDPGEYKRKYGEACAELATVYCDRDALAKQLQLRDAAIEVLSKQVAKLSVCLDTGAYKDPEVEIYDAWRFEP